MAATGPNETGTSGPKPVRADLERFNKTVEKVETHAMTVTIKLNGKDYEEGSAAHLEDRMRVLNEELEDGRPQKNLATAAQRGRGKVL